MLLNKLLKKSIFFTLFVTIPVLAQKDKEVIKPIPVPQSFITHHKGNFGGKTIQYKVTAKETYLKNKKGEPVASIWNVAYTQEGVKSSKRPVTFVFNGGPGSASVWLQMGMFGPKIVKVDSDAKKDDGAAPYILNPNKYGLLDITDLVFIDPVGTGYSRVIGKGKVKDFWGLNEDANSIAKFMRLWVTENNRWNAPKYIAGESFGTTRAVVVANVLERGGQNMALNGLILISQALDYEGSTSVKDNITSFINYLPSMAATAWYFKKAGQGKDLKSFVEACKQFTYDIYAPALYRGNLLSPAKKESIAEKLSYFIGLDKNYILRSNLRVLTGRFKKKLLEDKGLAIGTLDGRYTGDETDDISEFPHLGDPSSYRIGAAFTAALNYYFTNDLKVKMDRPYLTSNNSGLEVKWRWKPVPDGSYWEPSYVDVSRKLGETMRRNTAMKVFVAAGYYDLICPFFDTDYTFSRHGIVKERVTKKFYESGHMIYLHQPDMKKLAADIRAFLTKK